MKQLNPWHWIISHCLEQWAKRVFKFYERYIRKNSRARKCETTWCNTNESSSFMNDTSRKIAERESVKQLGATPLNSMNQGHAWRCPCIWHAAGEKVANRNMSNKPHGLVRGQERLPVQVACRSVPTADELASSLNCDDVWKIHKSSVRIHTTGWESER